MILRDWVFLDIEYDFLNIVIYSDIEVNDIKLPF